MQIELTKGFKTIIDDEDFEKVSSQKWHASTLRGRVCAAGISGKRPHRKTILLHRVLTNAPKGLVVDHINGNALDNRKSNLRICLNAQNVCNQMGHKDRKGRFKGVSFDKARNKWQASAQLDGKKIHAGRFEDEISAAKAYDSLARKLFGEFARTNF